MKHSTADEARKLVIEANSKALDVTMISIRKAARIGKSSTEIFIELTPLEISTLKRFKYEVVSVKTDNKAIHIIYW